MDAFDRAGHREDERQRPNRGACRSHGALSPDLLEVACAQRTVSVQAALELPDVMLLVVEDACARFAEQAWLARRPPRRDLRAAQRWRVEAAELHYKQDRVRVLADDCLDGPPTSA